MRPVTRLDFLRYVCRPDGTVNRAQGAAVLLKSLADEGGEAHVEYFGRVLKNNQYCKFMILVVKGNPIMSNVTGLPLVLGGQNGHPTRNCVKACLIEKTGAMRSGTYRVTEAGNRALHGYGPWPEPQEILLNDYVEALPDLAEEYRHMFDGVCQRWYEQKVLFVQYQGLQISHCCRRNSVNLHIASKILLLPSEASSAPS